MKLKIDIAEDIQEHEFENEEILVGSDSGCDVFLDYEGIGAKHIKIFKINRNYFVEDLGSGQETFIGGKLLESSAKSQVSQDTGIEVGGIYIYVEEDLKDLFHLNTSLSAVDETNDGDSSEAALETIDDLLNNASIANGDDSELESLVSTDVVSSRHETDEAGISDLFENTMPEEENILNRPKETVINEKFKPNLFDDSLIDENKEDKENDDLDQQIKGASKSEMTGSRKINIKQQNQDRSRKLKISTKASRAEAKSIKSKSARLKSRETIEPVKTQIIGLKMVFVICILVIGSGYIYYTDIYLPKLNKMISMEQAKVKTTIALITNPKIEKYAKQYVEFFKSEKCDKNSLKNQCNFIKGFFNPKDSEGSFRFQKQLFIGINEKNISKILNRLTVNLKDETFLRKEIESNYSELFDYERFKKSENKAPFKEFEDKRNKQKHSLAFIKILMSRNFSEIKSVKTIHFFSFKAVEKEFQIMDYLEIVPSVMSYKEQLKSATLLKLRSVWLHHLSLDAKRFVTSFGETSKYKYNNEMLLEEMAQKNLVSYKEYLTKKKCSSELTLQICKSISTDRARRSFEGAVVVGSRLLIYYQVDLIKNRYKDVFTGEYSNIDKKNLMNLFGKTNNQAMSLGDFQRNNYTSKMVSGDIARDSLISELVDSTYFQSIIESREITTVGLVGVVADPSNPSTAHMKLALEFEMKVLQRADQEKLIKQLPYFWKNQVPIFGDITNHLINHSTF